MKIWTVTYNDDSGVAASVFLDHEEAESAVSEWVDSYQRKFPNVDFSGHWQDVLEALQEQPDFMDGVVLEEHTITPTPYLDAMREALAALNVARERLRMNDLHGEEQPYIEDCATAILGLESIFTHEALCETEKEAAE